MECVCILIKLLYSKLSFNPSPQPDNPNPENPNPPPPLNHKQVIKKNIAASSNVVQLEDCFRQIVSLPSAQHGEKEEMTKDLANCLENIIKKVTKLVDLDALKKDCREAQFYLQNDELIARLPFPYYLHLTYTQPSTTLRLLKP